jgi:deoxyribonuclease-4
MRSVDSVVFGLELAHLAGGASLVVHAGTAPDGDISTALARLRSSVKKINRLAPKGGRLVFELTSGAGVPIAALPREIPRLFEAVEPFDDIGFCLDTQHLWAAGFDWTTDHAGDLLLEELDGLGLLDALACIHLNDSKSEMGSRLDRHENLGDGKIGIGPLVEFVTNPTLRDIPFILETPGSDAARRRELKRLRRAARVSLRTSARLRAVRGGRSEGSI